MNTYYQSNGEPISKGKIDRNVRKAKQLKEDEMMKEHGFLFCEDCGRSDSRPDRSHTISVKEAQESGRSELAWELDNIKMRCRTCHDKHDNLRRLDREEIYNKSKKN